MRNKYLNAFYWILSCLPLFFALLFLPALPPKIPSHYDMTGSVTQWGSKYESLIMPIITLATAILFHSLVKKSKHKNEKLYFYIGFSLVILFGSMSVFFLYANINSIENINDIHFFEILSLIISFSYIIIGNILPKCQPDKLLGFKTKWTLSSPEIWKKTHRFAGRMFILGAVIQMIIVQIKLTPNPFIVVLFVRIIIVSICFIYSIYLYRKEHR